MPNLRKYGDYTLLREAIKKKDKKQARNLLQNIASVNVPSAGGNSPLHWAIVKFNDVDIMSILLDKGANIHAKNHRRQKPLEVAVEINRTEAVKLLIRRGADVGENLNSLLLLAIQNGNTEIFKILFNYGMQCNLSITLNIILDAAITHGNLTIIELILPYNKILKPSDQYIPRQAVMRSGLRSNECVELLLRWNFIVNPDSKQDEDFIFTAVEKGYLPIVQQLVTYGMDVNMINSKTGLSLLKIACVKKHRGIAEILLKHGACLTTTTPIDHDFINFELVDRLSLNRNFRPISLTDDANELRNITCLHIAVLNSDSEITELLLKHGGQITDDSTFFEIACIAVVNNCEKIIRMFLDCGLNVKYIGSNGLTLLDHYFFSVKNSSSVLKLLLDNGATEFIKDPDRSFLFVSIERYEYELAQLFLDYNASVQYVDPHGNTPLHEAIKNHFDGGFIKSLLQRNSPVNAVNNYMLTPLLIACETKWQNKLEIVQMLLDYNANVNCTDGDMMTPLHLACQNQNREIAAALLEKGANPNATNNKGLTPLHLACRQGYASDIDNRLKSYKSHKSYKSPNSKLVRLLLQYNANIEAVDIKGWTPLFVACKTGNTAALKVLLSNHANANRTDLENLTPLYVAAKNCKSNPEIIKILLKHKVNVHCMDKKGNSVIHLIAATNSAELIKYFAPTQINFNSVNKKGDTPLHIAVREESVEMTKKLIKYGANVNILDRKKQTPLQNIDGHLWEYDRCHEVYQQMTNILIIHTIKLINAGLKVNKQNLEIVHDSSNDDITDDDSSDDEISDDDFSDDNDFYDNNYYYDDDDEEIDTLRLKVDCRREIKRMKKEYISAINMTFYDLLTKNIHFLSKYVRNKIIRQTLDLQVYDKKFPLYINIVRSRFRDAKFRYRMMNSATKFFTSNIPQRLPDNCIDTMFSYLNIKELKMLIRAMKPLEE